MRKLATAALSFSAAIFISHYLLPERWALRLAAGLLVVFTISLVLKGPKKPRLILITLPACAGLLWSFMYEGLFVRPTEALAGRQMTVSARVLDFAEDFGDYSVIYLRLTEKGLPGVTFALYSYGGEALPFSPGDEISATVQFASATRVSDIETDRYTSRGIFLRAYLKGSAAVTGHWKWSALYFPKHIGKAIRNAADLAFPADVAHLEKALLTGDRGDLYADMELNDAMGAAGIMHVVSVSGMHVSFLIGLVRTLSGGRRRRTAALGIPLILIFMPMAGGGASVIRAGFMQITLLIAPLLSREDDPVTSLSAVLAALLAANPFAAGSVSLQLSFAAMAGIILITPRISHSLTARVKPKNKLAKKGARLVISGFASTVGAIAFSTPLVAVHFGYVSILSPLTNLLTLSVMSLCFTVGYAVCVVWMLLPALGTALGWALAWLLRYVIAVVRLIAAVPFAAVYTENNFVAWWLAAAYAVFILCYIGRGKRGFRPVLPALLCVIMLCAAMLLTELRLDSRAGTLTCVDVGQGQSVVLISGRSTAVIDCGGSSAAARNTASYLLSSGRGSIDLLMLTHLHRDHAGGVLELMSRLSVGKIVMPADDPDDDGLRDAIEQKAAECGAQIYYISENTLLASSTVDIMALAPVGSMTVNERGVVFFVTVGEFDALIMGDAGDAVERRLVSASAIGKTDVLVVGHHGSRFSTSYALLDTAKPGVAVISVGYNSYGHPADETLERLYSIGAEVFRTDLNGNIEIRIS